MTEEIKEIIEHIKTYPEKMYCLSEKEKIRILDYITNLHQENERLARSIVSNDETLLKRNNEYEDYKSRCKKTINAINILQELIYQQSTENGADDMWLLDKLDGFKNILNGSDDK